MSKQTLRNILRWGGLGFAVIGFILGRTATSLQAYTAGRALVWAGLVMIIAAIFVRLFSSDK